MNEKYQLFYNIFKKDIELDTILLKIYTKVEKIND